MKKLISLILFLCLCVPAYAAKVVTPAPSGSGTYGELDGLNTWEQEQTFEAGISVGGGDAVIEFIPNLETITNADDDIVCLNGVGGTTDHNLCFDLDKNDAALVSRSFPSYSGATTSHPSSLNFISNITGYNTYGVGSHIRGGFFGNQAIFINPSGDTDLMISGGGALGLIGVTGDMDLLYGAGFDIEPFVLTNFTLDTPFFYGMNIKAGSSSIPLPDLDALILLNIEEPVLGVSQKQVNLEGEGSGAGIWFEGTTGECRLYTAPIATDCTATGGTQIEAGATYQLCAECE